MKQSFFLRGFLAAVGVAAALSAAGCGRGNVAPVQAAGSSPAAQNSQSPAPAVVPAAPPVVLTAGTHVHVRLDQTIDTKRNRAGDPFSATLAEALVAGDRVAVPAGTPFEGHVVTSIESGRFKGRADLALSLDSFHLNGAAYSVSTNTPARVSAAHKKRNWLFIGGGSGGGAALGAIAGGGAGALIGAGAGAAAGTVGAAFTGKRDVSLPAESTVTFTLRSDVPLGPL